MVPYLLFWIPHFIYVIWVSVAQWRCAFNATWTIWGYVVRILIIFNIVAIPLSLLFGGVLVGQDLIKAAECRKELQAYVAKGGTDVEGFKKQCIARQIHKQGESTQNSSLSSLGSGFLSGIDAGFECAKETKNYQKSGGANPDVFKKKCIEQRLQALKGPSPAADIQPVAIPPEQEKYKQQCEIAMTDVAQKSNTDPKAYIAQNQAYLLQCIQYYVSQDAVKK